MHTGPTKYDVMRVPTPVNVILTDFSHVTLCYDCYYLQVCALHSRVRALYSPADIASRSEAMPPPRSIVLLIV